MPRVKGGKPSPRSRVRQEPGGGITGGGKGAPGKPNWGEKVPEEFLKAQPYPIEVAQNRPVSPTPKRPGRVVPSPGPFKVEPLGRANPAAPVMPQVGRPVGPKGGPTPGAKKKKGKTTLPLSAGSPSKGSAYQWRR